MAVLFATLGFTAKLALAPPREHPEFCTVYLFYGTPEKTEGRNARKAVRATTGTLGVSFVEHKIKGAFDVEAILESFSKAYAATTGEDLYINGGGTRVMTMASTIFAFSNDLPLLYYDEYEATDGKKIPLQAFRQMSTLGKSQRAILAKLQEHSFTMGELASEVGLAPITLSVHVHRLERAGIVTLEQRGKNRLVSVVPAITRMGVPS